MEGALFRLVKGLAEHGSRRAFSRLTGKWPGERADEAVGPESGDSDTDRAVRAPSRSP